MRQLWSISARRVAPLAVLSMILGAVTLAAGSAPAADAAGDPVSALLKRTNAHRADEGLRPLDLQTGITDVSQDWSEEMRAAKDLEHNPKFATEIPSTADRAAENVGMACGYGSAADNAAAVMAAWLKSSGHEANITGGYSDIGIGVAYDKSNDCVWATQNFAHYSDFTATPKPTLSGKKKVGSVLTAKSGSWSPTPSTVTYRWLRDGKRIDGAGGRTYRVTKADRGHTITVKVIAKRSGYLTKARTSAGIAIPKAFTSAPTPTLSGTAKVGSKLTATAGTWSPTPATLKYRWFRDGNKISDATSRGYTLRKADKGHVIKVKVIVERKGYYTTTRTSSGKSVS
ncbi:CAP domain-containing protein [Demequina iriomotensis]|uniref:CAP domain-containing protein n=1 Tax=Demequina iriomotensis TaxID=1536641 RepID=UPI000783AEF0|nr:CAP domain-containing protein [Demequina iriomotensis]